MSPRFVISLDFELAWGLDPHKAYGSHRAHILGARDAIPRMLALADAHQVKCTWATVGLLFFDDRDEMLAALPEVLPSYRSDLSAYSRLDRVGPNEKADPLHFGLSLIRQIKDCPGQELAGHTFSHYYCLEDDGRPEAFQADLAAATRAAERIGVRLDSLVFPRNQVRSTYLQLCREAGYQSYRGTADSILYQSRPRDGETRLLRLLRGAESYNPFPGSPKPARLETTDGMLNIRASRFLRPVTASTALLSRLQLKRIEHEMTLAAITGSAYHLWWHPENFGHDTDLNLSALSRIFRHYRQLASRYGMVSVTMHDLTCQTAIHASPERRPPASDLAAIRANEACTRLCASIHNPAVHGAGDANVAHLHGISDAGHVTAPFGS